MSKLKIRVFGLIIQNALLMLIEVHVNLIEVIEIVYARTPASQTLTVTSYKNFVFIMNKCNAIRQ